MPGGRLEPGEDPAACLAREVAEELGAEVAIGTILDSWVYEVVPQREVLIVTYGLRCSDQRAMRVSGEHRRFGLFALSELDGLPMPDGYRLSIRAWAAQCGEGDGAMTTPALVRLLDIMARLRDASAAARGTASRISRRSPLIRSKRPTRSPMRSRAATCRG